MPALFSFGQHPALEAVQAQLQNGERLFDVIQEGEEALPISHFGSRYFCSNGALHVHVCRR